MGNFYVSISVRGGEQKPVAALLEALGRTAFVTKPEHGWVVVYDEACDAQDDAEIRSLGEALSGQLKRPVLAVLNHDDDILAYWLFAADGTERDTYDSAPGYFDPQAGDEPLGGDADTLCRTLEVDADRDAIAAILHPPEPPTLAVEQHANLAELLGIPSCSVGFGFKYVQNGELESPPVLGVGGVAPPGPRRRAPARPRAVTSDDAGAGAPATAGAPGDAVTIARALQVLSVLESKAAGSAMAEHLRASVAADREFLQRLKAAAERSSDASHRDAIGRLLALLQAR